MDITEALEQTQPGLIGRVKSEIRQQQLNQRAEQNYLHWIARFVLFHDMKDPENLASEDRQAFLAYLRDRIQVSRARLNQASQALTFFYQDVLNKSEVSGSAAA